MKDDDIQFAEKGEEGIDPSPRYIRYLRKAWKLTDTEHQQRVSAFANTLMPGITLCILYVYISQLSAMRESVDLTRQALRATIESNDIARKQMQVGYRAWITV